MWCTNCGSELEDGAKFCVNCGTTVEQQPTPAQDDSAQDAFAPRQQEQAPTQPQQQATAPQPPTDHPQVPAPLTQAAPKKRSAAVPITIAAIVIVAIAIVLVVVFLIMPQQGNDTSSSDSGSPTAQAVEPTFENNVFRITLPADVADKVTFQTGTKLDIVYVNSTEDNGGCIAELFPKNQASDESGEAGYAVYSLGTIDLAGVPDEAIMSSIYVDANGSSIYMGRPEAAVLPVMTALEKYLGITPDEFAACVEIKTANGFEPSTPQCIGNGDLPQRIENAKKSSSGAPASAFWGIWAPASKDKAEMEATAEQIKEDTGIDAFVVLTTDWSNLNSEPWYVVSLGQYATEEAAKEALPNVQRYYSDAYVKYSGARK